VRVGICARVVQSAKDKKAASRPLTKSGGELLKSERHSSKDAAVEDKGLIRRGIMLTIVESWRKISKWKLKCVLRKKLRLSNAKTWEILHFTYRAGGAKFGDIWEQTKKWRNEGE